MDGAFLRGELVESGLGIFYLGLSEFLSRVVKFLVHLAQFLAIQTVGFSKEKEFVVIPQATKNVSVVVSY